MNTWRIGVRGAHANKAVDPRQLLSEPALAEDWNRPEDDEAHLQQVRWFLLDAAPCRSFDENSKNRFGMEVTMAWDFSTEPEYQKKLDWVRDFVECEVRPLEFIYNDLTQEQLQRMEALLQAEVKRQGLWAAHLDPIALLGAVKLLPESSVQAPQLRSSFTPGWIPLRSDSLA